MALVAQKLSNEELLQQIEFYNEKIELFKGEVRKVFVGQNEVLNATIVSLLARGHILLEGAPGLAKTLLVMTIAKTVRNAKFQRIQFTPDLLPADITGITAYDPNKGFYVVKGPVFANFLLADEINRAPPKVQSAMLSVMQERQVVIGKEIFNLEEPFFVMATQNPVEQQGTYPLPEAQVDRFLFKVFVYYPTKEEELIILDRNTTIHQFDSYEIVPVLEKEDFPKMQELVKQIHASDEIKKYIVDIVDATRNPDNYGIEYGRYIAWGGSPRANIALYISAKAHAFLERRTYVLPEDVRKVAHNVLRHRIILNYEGKAIDLNTDTIIDEILRKVEVP
ncbi:MAG: MoxR family ATPase [Candidatus Nanohaloarchaeota archaeon]|nr:MoxR family ATPase [Candidatus Nanohaloarchaeota archaeon]